MSTKKKTIKKRVVKSNKDELIFLSQLIISFILFFSIYGYQLMGPFGEILNYIGYNLFSDALPLLPWVLFFSSFVILVKKDIGLKRYFMLLMGFMMSFLTFVDSFFPQKIISIHGVISRSMTETITFFGAKIFGMFGVRLMLFSVAILSFVSLFQISFKHLSFKPSKKTKKVLYKGLKHIFRILFYTKHTNTVKKKSSVKKPRGANLAKLSSDLANSSPVKEPIQEAPIKEDPLAHKEIIINNTQKKAPSETDIISAQPKPIPKASLDQGYVLPPLELLAQATRSNAKQIESDMKQKSKALEIALDSFNVAARVVHITIGPSVSRFELKPGEGVKISKITNLAQDIALKLAVPTVRIEAPIPGKPLIGIEVPNVDIAPLNLRTIINPATFFDGTQPLDSILGLRITGESVMMDLNKMPHILVAGSTGSGKSVCVNAIIISILMKATPDEVKFLMIDPKKVELSLYSGIPHLLAPVVTNPNKAAATLKQWALVEMERRYELFTEHGVKDLAGFNTLAKASDDPELKPIPYIVVIIDEFADLMMVASQEVENTICRLAQMARATGIHLVLATQRPSVNVVTGLIKANIPSRISFAVQSQIDSRTVLDMSGAEKLLGRGDMLYMPIGATTPVRVQGVFVSEKEVNAVVDFIKKQAVPDYLDEIIDVEPLEESSKSSSSNDTDSTDDLYEKAKEMIQSTQYASTSYLQRKLRIGYNRAARLMDELEENGVISSYDGEKKTRTVLPG